MKKFLFFFAVVAAPGVMNAQVSLNGTSYTQNFDGIGTALPTGCELYTGATETSLGTQKNLQSSSKGTKYPWWNVSGGFKNVASGNGLTASADSISQDAATDRALAVRQVSSLNTNFPNSDPGAAFVFHIANTMGLSKFALEFKLQSLDDRSHRQTPWAVEYAVGDNPSTFTPVTTTPSTLTTGGDTYSNTTVTATLPLAIENSLSSVYIRIVSSGASSITTGDPIGNRATSAIDDFKLTWVGLANGVAAINAVAQLPLSVLGNATRNQITLSYQVAKAGRYNVTVCDVAGRIVYKAGINAPIGAQQYTINNLNLQSGLYIIKMGNDNAIGTVKAMVN